jgi:phosphatidylethanolamine/phosphatidyl-N-methylethanolamine N-methyltransferase
MPIPRTARVLSVTQAPVPHAGPIPDTRPAVEAVYARLAPLYDLVYGAALWPGRTRAMQRLAPRPGERLLEVGIGTGLSALAYPRTCRVVAIDISAPMLARAQARLARRNVENVRLCRMDAARLAFPDGAFDAVYAPYVINVVPDPVRAACEMHRVCRRGGRLVFLNHFRPPEGEDSPVDRVLGRVASLAGGADWALDLQALMAGAGLAPHSVERVNLPRVSSVVVCVKP